MIEIDTFFHRYADELGLNRALINPHSVDVCLGHNIIEMWEGGAERRIRLELGQEFQFRPGFFYLAETLENIHVPETHRAQLHLKSSTARRGLNHLMAAYIDAGWRGVLTLEFVAHMMVTFRCGRPIMQIEYSRLNGIPERTYEVTGRYQGSTQVEKARPPLVLPTIEDIVGIYNRNEE